MRAGGAGGGGDVARRRRLAGAVLLRSKQVFPGDRRPVLCVGRAGSGGGDSPRGESPTAGGAGDLRWRRPLATRAAARNARLTVLPKRKHGVDGDGEGSVADHGGGKELDQDAPGPGPDISGVLQG